MSESEEKISWETIKRQLEEKLKPVTGDLQKINVVMNEHLEWLVANYNRLTPEAQQTADSVFDGLADSVSRTIEDALPRLPDSMQTRKLKRSLLGMKGKRLLAQPHTEVFDKPVVNPTPIQTKARDIFQHQLQVIMDLYQDIVPRTFSGPAQFNQLSLLGSCIDELLVAFSLSQRSYTGQAMAHLRTIQEALDLTRLFRDQPQWAELWNSDKPWQEVWAELSPGRVQKKIKSSKFKEIYESLSSLGTHPTFSMMRLRCKVRKEEGKENPQIDIKIGGTPKIKENITVHMLLLLSLSMVLAELTASFNQFLDEEEISHYLIEFMETFVNFSLEFILKPLRESGIREAEEVEKNIKEGFEEMKKELTRK